MTKRVPKRVKVKCINGPFDGKELMLTSSESSTGVFTLGEYRGFYSQFQSSSKLGNENRLAMTDPGRVYWHNLFKGNRREYRVLQY